MTLRVALLAAAALAAAPFPAAAEAPAAPEGAPLMLTIEEAVRLAGVHAWDVRKAEEREHRLQGLYRENRANALPQLTLGGYASRTGDQAQGDLGGPVSGGGEGVFLSASQPLFTWGKVSAAIRAAELGLDDWKDQREIARQAATRDVTVAFYDLLLAQELLVVAKENLAQKTRLREESARKLEAGTATDYDVLAAEVSERNARPAIIRAENLVRLARDQVRFLTGSGAARIEAAGTLAAPPLPTPTYEEALAAGLAHRPELVRLRRGIAVAEEVVKIRAAGDKPSLSVQGQTGWNTVRAGGDEGDGANWSAQLVFSFPFFDGWRTAGEVAQARSEVASLQLDEAQFRDALTIEAKGALSQVQEATETLAAVEGTLSQAERLLAMAEKGYALGVKTKIEVDEANLNLVSARVELARARRNLLAARTGLAWVMGAL